MIEDFHRIKRLPPYVFAEVNALKASARADGADIIDLGMGNPDMQTPQHIVDKLVETVTKPRVHRYSASKGIPGLRRAQAAYYARRFGVKLDPETQVVATLGSKEGFANMAQAIAAPGDVILTPNPTYPIHEFGFLISGASVRHLPASNGDEFLAAVSRACKHTVPKPIAMVLSYPSNPTAMTATREFYAEAVQLAKREGLIILSDLAYSEIYYDGNPPPSVLEIPGAMDLAVEFTSLSKTYSMPGWRIGFAVGNERFRMGYKTQGYRDLYSVDYHIGKTAYEDVEEYKKRSPAWQAHKLETPLLIHTNTNDADVNVLEVEHLIKSLKAEGKKFEYEIYEDIPGGHSFDRIDSRKAQEIRLKIYKFLGSYLDPPKKFNSVKDLRKASYRF